MRVKDGEQAIRHLFERGLLSEAPETPHSILLAAELPIVSVSALVDRLRQHPRTRTIPVIVLRRDADGSGNEREIQPSLIRICATPTLEKDVAYALSQLHEAARLRLYDAIPGCHLTTVISPVTLQVRTMDRAKHPKQEVEQALRHAERHGWRIEPGGSHAWGRMYCPHNTSECRCGRFCIASIWSTPKNVGIHARHLRRVVDNCVIRALSGAECGEE